MARIVELGGPPGVGKSTLFNEMSAQWSIESSWIPAHFLYPQQKLRFDSLSSLLLSFERKFTISEGNVDERELKEYGDRFIAQYPSFINACWNNIFSVHHSSNGTDLRFDKARYLFDTLQKFQFLAENKINKTSVLDEGLIHRLANGLYRQKDLDAEKEEIYNLVQVMPLPDAFIYIKTDVEEIARRLYNRKKVIISHKSLSLAELENSCRQSLERMSIVLENVAKRDIPVLHVNSKQEIGKGTRVIIRFIESLNKEKVTS